MAKQELVDNWKEWAKAQEKAEIESVRPFVIISIEDKTIGKKLKQYDVPREVYFRQLWFVRYILAKYQVQQPKHEIVSYYSFYDKKTGLNYGIGSCLSKMVSYKAKITLIKKRQEEYRKYMQEDLFFDEATDEFLAKCKSKIEKYELAISELESYIKKAAEEKKTDLND